MNKKRMSVMCLLSLLVLVGCGKRDEKSSETDVTSSNIIVGELDWQEISVLDESHPVRKQGVAVADISIPVLGSRCTGFMVAPDILMTNQHCIPTSRHADGVTAIFNHQANVSASKRIKYKCDTFIGNNSTLDYALLRCKQRVGEKYGMVKLTSNRAITGQDIYIVQQNCDYYYNRRCDWNKKFSRGKFTKIGNEYTHNADTLGGSSGSPVFDEDTNRVIALHHAGRGNNGKGRGIENYAVPMYKIVSSISSSYPSVKLNGIHTTDSNNSGNTNDTMQTASKVNLPFSVKNKKISHKEDLDYYRFVVSSSKTVNAGIGFYHSKGDLDLYLLNSAGKVVSKSVSETNHENVSKKLSQGIYYVVVKGYKGALGFYNISIK